MKPHIVVKLHRPVQDEGTLPTWLEFIHDKSRARESVEPGIDRVLKEQGIRFWVTREYAPAMPGTWSADEIRSGFDRTLRLILQQDHEFADALIARIRALPSVEEARALDVGESELPVSRIAMQASLGRGYAPELIHLAYAHAITRGHPEVKIAVLDTGVNLAHRELQGRIGKCADFVDLAGLPTAGFIGDYLEYDNVPEDEVGHGTHVSGILAAEGLQMDEGVASRCTLLAVRVLASMKSNGRLVGAGIVDNINVGIKWAVDHGADVINMSLGVKHAGGGLPHEDVIRYALARGVTVVAASGNDGTGERYYPGALDGVIAVGAVDPGGSVAPFTSYGASITVVAPGVQIYSAFADDGYGHASGTSQASPFVAGAIALLKSYALEHGRRLSNAEVLHVLRQTSDRVDSRLRHEHAGYGLINLADAFKHLIHHLSH